MRTRTVVLFVAVSLLPAVGFGESASSDTAASASVSYSSPRQPAEFPAPSAAMARAARDGGRPSGVGVAFRMSLLGLGGEAAVALSHYVNLRGGFNAFSYSRGFSKDGINYAADLRFRSAEAHVDWFPFGGRLHLSPGVLLYNGNKMTANASVPGGQTFTLGGTQYMSQPGNPITGSGKLEFNKAAPTVMVGLGNLVPRRRGKHFSANFEVGAAFAGAPQATLNLSGGVCDPTGLVCRDAGTDPTFQGSVQSEQRKINSDLSAFKVYPVAALSFGYRF